MTSELLENDIDQLNSFLRGEISAVETYDQGLAAADNSRCEDVLRANRESHADRVKLLSDEISRLGGDPATGSGAWGAFAKAVAGGAKVFGESAAVAALLEGEDHGLSDYRRDLPDLSVAGRELVASTLLPAQEGTYNALNVLRELKS